MSNNSNLPKAGSLVKFRAMVQDTGYGSELYKAIGDKDELLMYGIEETDEGNSSVRVSQPDASSTQGELMFGSRAVLVGTRGLSEAEGETGVLYR